MAVFVGGEDESVPMPVTHVGVEAVSRWRESPSRHLGRRVHEDTPLVPLLSRQAPLRPSPDRIVACLEVATISDGPLSELDRSMAEAVALRRVQRAVRPSDRVSLVGGMRLAVSFGTVSQGTDATRLAERVADAVGDHLTIGEQSIGLEVGIGVAVGPLSTELPDLTDEALRKVAARSAAASATGPHPDRDTADTEALTARPALRGPVLAVSNGHGTNNGRGGAPGDGATATRVLVVDAVPGPSGQAGVTAQAVGACLAQVGVKAHVIAPVGGQDVAEVDGGSSRDTVLLVVHPAAVRTEDPDASREWEQPGTLCRTYRGTGAAVVVVSIGAAAAALAGCVEQGATGVIHIEDLPHHASELARHLSADDPDNECTNGARTAWARSPRFDPARLEPLMQLTPSERKVLYHLTSGSSASEIAGLLVVSIATVRSHIRSILRKLDVGSQLAAVAIARGEHSGASSA
jgi:DNA-binding NarL/FixJ family response regulator